MSKRKMRVLNLLTSGQIGGIEILCYNWAKSAEFENGFAFFAKGGAVFEKIVDGKFEVYNLSTYRCKYSLRKLVRLLKIAQNYDCIVAHHGDPIVRMYYIFLALFTKKKMVNYVHSCYGDESQQKYGKVKKLFNDLIFQKSFDVSDTIIAVSDAGRRSLQKKYRVPSSKIHIVYNGISNEILKAGSFHEVDAGRPFHILYIGRLVQIKGVDLLLRAVKQIMVRYDITVDIVGDGSERGRLEEVARTLEISDIVSFWGEQTQIQEYLKKAHVFVYPSICEEVFGISIVEAMSYGIPCVANRVGGIPEVIDNGENGYLTENTSSQEIARLVIEILQKYEDGSIYEMCNAAKRKAGQFTIEQNCSAVQNILEHL